LEFVHFLFLLLPSDNPLLALIFTHLKTLILPRFLLEVM